jgi:flagellar hook protein FlgE
MSLFSSLNTGVLGLNAQSKATAMISDNIANLNSTGYKKSDTIFHDLVTNTTKPGRFDTGGVSTEQLQRVDIQGKIQQTSSRTEIGITGPGLFTVKADDDPGLEFLYTRNGTFSPDEQGYLRNAAGFVLYAWPVDVNGNVVSGTDLTSLEAADVDQLNDTFRPTTQLSLSINLNADEDGINPLALQPQQSYPVSNQPVDFSRIFTVVDGDGATRDLTFQFRKIVGPMATATTRTTAMDADTSLANGSFFSGINPGDTFSMTASGATREYIIGAPAGAGQIRVDTVGELLSDINNNLGGGNVVDANLDDLGRIVFRNIDATDNISFTEIVGTPLSGGSGTLDLVNQPGYPALTYAPININAAYPDQGSYPAIDNAINPNPHGWWEVTILKPDPSLPDCLALMATGH